MKKITLLSLFLFALSCWQVQAQFEESFDSGIPAEWTVANADGGLYTWSAGTAYPHSGAGNAVIHWESAAHQDYLITPEITVTAGVSDRISFWTGINGTVYMESFKVKLSTTGTDPADFTVELGNEVAVTNAATGNFNRYIYDLTPYAGQNVYIAIEATDTDKYYLYVDDFANDTFPAAAPNCDAALTSPADGSTDNQATGILTWTAATGDATGYKLSVGTTSNGTDVINNFDVGNVLTFDIPGLLSENTTYYVTIKPYNVNGDATGCSEFSFTTGAYLEGDFCSNAIDLATQTSPLSGTTVGALNDSATNCNNSSEIVNNTAPDLYYSILVPVGSTLTIGQTLNGFDSAITAFYGNCDTQTQIACFDDDDYTKVIWANDTGADQTVYWIEDGYGSNSGTFTLEWSVVACTNATASFAMVSDCANGEQFLISVDVTDLGSATSLTASDDQGSATQSVTATGVIQFGPYTNTTPVVITLTNDQNADCAINSAAITQNACPPANDNCDTADSSLIVNEDFDCANTSSGSLAGATDSGAGDNGAGNPDDDVWFSFVATSASHRISLLNVTGNNTDLVHELLSGTCDALTSLNVNDNDTSNVSGLVPGDTYYVRVFTYGSSASNTTFDICIGTPPPPPSNDQCANAIDLTELTSPIEGSTEFALNDSTTNCNNDGETITNTAPDLYYSIVVPSGSSLTIGQTVNNFDSGITVFYGDCDNQTQIACFDDDDYTHITWANATGSAQTVYWIEDGHSTGSGTFTLEWSVVACMNATATYTVISDCANGEQFLVDADITDIGSATTLTVSDDQGSASQTITTAGIVHFGPYANNTPVIITVANDQDSNCFTTSNTLNQVACPPSNDECANAVELTAAGTFDDAAVAFTTVGATRNAANPIPTCDALNFDTSGKDVWFTVTVPESGTLTLETGTAGDTNLVDTGMQAFIGTCDALTLVECNTDDGVDNFSKLELEDLTPGETLLVRVYGYNGTSGAFNVAAYDESLLGTPTFDNANFRAFPNPVKDILNLSYTQNISSVAVFNLVGLQVIAKTIDNNQSQVDMSSLSAGTYLVKITADDQVKTIKIIKE